MPDRTGQNAFGSGGNARGQATFGPSVRSHTSREPDANVITCVARSDTAHVTVPARVARPVTTFDQVLLFEENLDGGFLRQVVSVTVARLPLLSGRSPADRRLHRAIFLGFDVVTHHW